MTAMPPDIQILRLSGPAVVPYLKEAARLRIAVFRDYPYLYEGSEDYEKEYLATYAESDGCVFVVALQGGEVIGVSTGLPLAQADEAFIRPFADAGLDPEQVFYFGESVLKHESRGQGIGHRFFDERERHALDAGFRITAFCAVERPADHAERPADYRANDAFWLKRGYTKTPTLCAELEWRRIDKSGENAPNSLIFWVKWW